MKLVTLVTASPVSKVKLAETPIERTFGPGSAFPVLRLVEEAALEHARAILGRQLDVAGREEKDLVGDALHATVERVGETAGEVDQPLRQLGVSRLEVEDHGDAVLEAVGDLLGVVEAAREDQVDPGGAGPLH